MKLITIVYNDSAILPFFLGHYAALGVTHFLIGAYDQGVKIEALHQQCKGYRYDIFPIDGGFAGEKDTETRHRLAARFMQPNEWWGVADVDEFHEFPSPLPQLIRDLDRSDHNFLQSYLLDRITTDGTCPALRIDKPLWDQFPAAAYITPIIMAALSTKIMLIRGATRVIPGHHDPGRNVVAKIRQGGIVHHFKWFGDVVSKMEERRKVILNLGQPQFRKCERFLRFWDDNHRLPIEGELGFFLPTKPKDWPDVLANRDQ